MDPISLYETSRGDFAPPQSLSPDEALDLYRRGVLEAADYDLLTEEAAIAIALEVEAKVRGQRPGVVVFWGVARPTRAHQGRA